MKGEYSEQTVDTNASDDTKSPQVRNSEFESCNYGLGGTMFSRSPPCNVGNHLFDDGDWTPILLSSSRLPPSLPSGELPLSLPKVSNDEMRIGMHGAQFMQENVPNSPILPLFGEAPHVRALFP